MLYVLEPDLDNMENTGAGGQVVEATVWTRWRFYA